MYVSSHTPSAYKSNNDTLLLANVFIVIWLRAINYNNRKVMSMSSEIRQDRGNKIVRFIRVSLYMRGRHTKHHTRLYPNIALPIRHENSLKLANLVQQHVLHVQSNWYSTWIKPNHQLLDSATMHL